MQAPMLPPLLDLAGIAVFALSGALLATRLKQTLVTVAFFALVTGVGGGSVRDVLIGAPVFWVRDAWVAPVVLLTALIAWFTPRHWWEGRLLEWADAVGLGAYAGLGTAKALGWARMLQEQLGLTDGQVSFLRYHGEHDGDHVRGMHELLGPLMADPVAGAAIVRTARVTARLYALQLEEIR